MKLYSISDNYINYLKKYAEIIYNQKINNYNVSYINNVVKFKLLEEKCLEYRDKKNI